MRATSKYPNLEAERARRGLTIQDLADALGISRLSFGGKSSSGKFTANECKTLCSIMNKDFEYLFKEADDEQEASGD